MDWSRTVDTPFLAFVKVYDKTKTKTLNKILISEWVNRIKLEINVINKSAYQYLNN